MLQLIDGSLFFDKEKLISIAKKNKKSYISAKPFPHIIFNDFLPKKFADKILENFPSPERIEWKHYKSVFDKKLESKNENELSPFIRNIIAQFNSVVFLEFLEELTGITDLIPDPYLFGGGLHQIERGGFLKIHADFNYHPRMKLDRRINFLLFFNKNWEEAYDGHLELWNKSMTRCEKKILPVFNKCVIFSTTSDSYHGHPDPLKCPEGMTRKSLALYYYTNGRPEYEKRDGHSTLWQARPGEKKVMAANRMLFLKEVAKSCAPNFFLNIGRKLRNVFRKDYEK